MLEVITDNGRFDEIESDWRALLDAVARPSPYLFHAWLANTARHASHDPCVFVLWDGQSIAAALPLHVARRAHARVGSHLSGPISSPLDALATTENASSHLAALVKSVAGRYLDALWIEGLDPSGLLAQTDLLKLRVVDVAPVLAMPLGWAQAATNSTRPPGRRQLKRLMAQHAVRFTVAKSACELDEALTAAFSVHAARWQGKPDASRFSVASSQAFHRALVADVGDDDIARIALLHLNGQVVAFDFYFVVRDVMYAYRTAYLSRARGYSPGLLTIFHAALDASDSGATCIDWGRGREPYKLNFSNQTREVCEGTLALNGRGAAWLAGRALRRPVDAAIRANPHLYRAYLRAVTLLGR